MKLINLFLLLPITTFFLYAGAADEALPDNLPTGVQLLNSVNDGCIFIENKGQWPEEVKFLAKTENLNAWITNNGLVYDFYTIDRNEKNNSKDMTNTIATEMDEEDYTMQRHVVKMKFKGSKITDPAGKTIQSGYYNYFIGGDKSKWVRSVRLFKEIHMGNIYKGIDVRLYFDKGMLRYDFVGVANSDLSRINIEFEGQGHLEVNDRGELAIHTSLGVVEHRNLYAYQVIDGEHKEIECNFKIEGGTVQFNADKYDKSKPIIIDPLVYSSFIGGRGEDYPRDITVDEYGYSYITGYTNLGSYPVTSGDYDESFNGGQYDIFVSKISTEGDLEYSTFIGGYHRDVGYGVAVDDDGCAYITGYTASNDFPTSTDAYDKRYDGNLDSYVAKLSEDGGYLVYSTYLGGFYKDVALGITVDQNNDAYITGYTESWNFPTSTNAFDRTHNYGWDVFVTKLSESGGHLEYSTYIGGSREDAGRGIAVDAEGFAYISGWTQSSNYPATNGAFDESFNGSQDGFVTKLSSNADNLEYSTFLGGSRWEKMYDISLGENGCSYITGSSSSSDYPVTAGAYDEILNNNGPITYHDAIITKLSSSGETAIYSTFVGGSKTDIPHSISVDENENAIISGYTYSEDFPATPGAFDETHNGGYTDCFVSKISTDGSANEYSSFLGGNSYDYTVFSDIDEDGCVYLAGQTNSLDFPTTPGAFQENYDGGWYDGFVSKIRMCNGPVAKCKNATVYLDDNGEASISISDINDGSSAGCGLSDITISENTFDCSDIGQNTVTMAVTDIYGNTAECVSMVTVIDNIPPEIYVSVNPQQLWPPNHKMKSIKAAVSVSDNCPGAVYYLESIISNEPDNGLGDGDKENDIQNAEYETKDLKFDLRAERSGKGNGRIYNITYRAEDVSGNHVTASANVLVNHSNKRESVTDLIIEKTEEADLVIGCHPNPASNYIILNIKAKRDFENVRFIVTDIWGNTVRPIFDKRSLDEGIHSIRYDLNSLPSGAYYYTIRSGSFSTTKLLNIIK